MIPVLAYDDPDVAAEWPVRAFGFRVRLRIGGHRWTFSQSIAAVDPADWGGEAVGLD